MSLIIPFLLVAERCEIKSSFNSSLTILFFSFPVLFYSYMNAEKYGLDRIYFGGCFIRGHAATISTLSYAIRFWSRGTVKAMFLRHEGFLGSIGAWIKNVDKAAEQARQQQVV